MKDVHRWKFIGKFKESFGLQWRWRCSKCGELTFRRNPRIPSGKTVPSCSRVVIAKVMES